VSFLKTSKACQNLKGELKTFYVQRPKSQPRPILPYNFQANLVFLRPLQDTPQVELLGGWGQYQYQCQYQGVHCAGTPCSALSQSPDHAQGAGLRSEEVGFSFDITMGEKPAP
jgi:hypothetical protein